MSKDDMVYVGHMLEMSEKALDFVSGLDKTAYEENEQLRLALIYIIQILGEAARQVSPEFKAAHPEISWHEIIGMRHRIVHDYMNVDEDVVWEVVWQDLPRLVAILMEIVPPEEM
jgi:uncharacterized protein with HEPN domain